MGSYQQNLYQIVFSTKYRKPVLLKKNRTMLFNYIIGIITNKKCFVHEINGIEDHIHIILSLHPSVALALLIKDIKVGSNLYIKENNLFENFTCWAEGYGAFTYSQSAKKNLINYVKNQEAHHAKETSIEELVRLLLEHGIVFDPKFLD